MRQLVEMTALTPEEALEILTAAGWHADRRREVWPWMVKLRDRGIAGFDAAERFLAEFGGLEVPAGGAGINVARVRFAVDPTTPWLVSDIREFEIGGLGPFCPVGDVGQAREGALAIDPSGEVFVLCADAVGRLVIYFGAGLDAVLNLVRGNMQLKARLGEEWGTE
jgi:hypothetical protein